MEKLLVGQTVFLRDATPVVIKKVGIKYFYISNLSHLKFDKKTLISVGGFRNIQVFLSKEEPQNKKDLEFLFSKIKQKFNDTYTAEQSGIPLEKLKEIVNILEII